MSYTLDSLKINASFLKENLFRTSGERKRALYYGWLGFRNLGDEALFYCIEQMFRDSIDFCASGRFERLYFKETAFASFDMHFVGGGTLINRNTTTIDTLLKYREKVPVGVALGTGVADEQFWQQFEDRCDRSDDWRDYLNSCRFVGVRGPDSLAFVQRLGVQKAVITGDPVLYLGSDRIVPKGRKKRIGLNFGATNGRLWGKSDEHVENEVLSLIRILLEDNWEISFFNVYIEDAKSYHNFIGRNNLQGKIRFFDASDCLINKALDYFKDIDVFVGEKLHASVFAACTYTPFVMLEYEPKCLDFMKSIGYEKYNYRTDRLNADEIFTTLKELYDDSVRIQQHLKKRVMHYQNILVASALKLVQVNANDAWKTLHKYSF